MHLSSAVYSSSNIFKHLISMAIRNHGVCIWFPSYRLCLWGPVTTEWRVFRLRMEERPPIWRVAANKLNKQSRTAEKGCSSSFGVGRGANDSSPWKTKCFEIFIGEIGIRIKSARFFGQRGTDNFCICGVVPYVTEVSAELDASIFSDWDRLFLLNIGGAFSYFHRGRKRDKCLVVRIQFGRSDDGQSPQKNNHSLVKSRYRSWSPGRHSDYDL